MSIFQMETLALDARPLLTRFFCWPLTCLAQPQSQPVHLAAGTLGMGSSAPVRGTYCMACSLPEPPLFPSAKWED